MPTAATESPASGTLIVAPEPVDWLDPVRALLAPHGPVEVLAPWALPRATPKVVRESHDFFRRRAMAERPRVGWFPAFATLELGVRGYARGKAARQFAGRLFTRGVVDRTVGAALRRGAWPGVMRVVAPSLAARHTFAAARQRGMRCVLLEDAPDLRELAETLDELAERYPECPFLRNHRPHRRVVVDQRAERELANLIGVRGGYAWRRLESRAGPKLFGLDVPLDPKPPSKATPGTVAFVGPPVGRSGTMHLHQLAHRLPELRFVVAGGNEAEPQGLFDHPRISAATRAERERMEPAIVLSLTAVESHPWEVRRAIELGRPVVGTAISLGQVQRGSAHLIDVEDLDGVGRALREAADSPAPPRAWVPSRRFAAFT